MGALLSWATRYRVAIILSILVVLGIVSYRVVNGITEYRLVVPLDSADGLYPGSDVLIAGAKAGTVRDIGLDGTQTLVTIAVDDAYAPLHADARVTVRPKSLLGEKYVALDPGTSDALASGTRLPQQQVARSVELQDVVNSLDQPTFDGPQLVEVLAAALASVKDLGTAAVGDKTMVDSLEPAVEMLRSRLADGASLDDAIEEAAVAAEAGMRSTIPLQARKGRASYLGERSVGHQDPGATSTALIVRALQKAVTKDS